MPENELNQVLALTAYDSESHYHLPLTEAGVEDDELNVFKPSGVGERRIVVAIDSSSMPLAIARDYWLVLTCLAMAVRDEERGHVLRFGPSLVKVKKRGREGDPAIASRIAREIIEKEAVTHLIYNIPEARKYIVLVDGTLDDLSPIDLSVAANKDVMVIGVSKVSDRMLKDLVASPKEQTRRGADLPKKTMVTKLVSKGVVLRVDTVYPDPKKALDTLVSSDVLVRGYPDTLRIAHYSALISKLEEEAAKAVLVSKGAVLIRGLDKRKTLLGPLRVRGAV